MVTANAIELASPDALLPNPHHRSLVERLELLERVATAHDKLAASNERLSDAHAAALADRKEADKTNAALRDACRDLEAEVAAKAASLEEMGERTAALEAVWADLPAGAAQVRLAQELRKWRRERPYGFVARPQRDAEGKPNLLKWDIGIPGRDGGLWEGGLYKGTLTFTSEYPAKPPKSGFFHANVFPSGAVALPLLNARRTQCLWTPTVSVREILLAVQELLESANFDNPAQKDAYTIGKKDMSVYERLVREQAKDYKSEWV